jgi:hypothetical protein
MDGGKTSYDKPPPGEPTPILEPGSAPLNPPPMEDAEPSPVSESEQPFLPPVTQATHLEDAETRANPVALGAAPLAAIAPTPAGPVAQVTSQRVPQVVVVSPTAVTAHREMEPIGRPLKIAFGIVFGLLAVSTLGFLVVHVSHSAKGGPQRAAAATSTTVSGHDSTTTSVPIPSAPKPSAEAAAQALVSSWSTGNRLAALSVATPAAATTLFAATYNSGLVIDRGCSTSFTPIVCTFGPPGGASPTDPIYEILVSQSSGGWYVSSVKIEN